MEVRLPAQVVSQRSELVETEPPTPSPRDAASPIPSRAITPSVYHRITQLSLEPSLMLAGVCKAQVVFWMTLPLRVIYCRLVAAHYLATGGSYLGTPRILHPIPGLGVGDPSQTSIGLQLSRIALCSSVDLAIDLTLWGFSYIAIVYKGTKEFGWGML